MWQLAYFLPIKGFEPHLLQPQPQYNHIEIANYLQNTKSPDLQNYPKPTAY
jgi:hypothetical protein